MAETIDIYAYRPQLQAIAYRMLGSMAEAEDAVQETYLRWHRQDQAEQVSEIREPKAWLITTLTRHCIDRLRAAKAQRESYFGMWLPEPVVEGLDYRLVGHGQLRVADAVQHLRPAGGGLVGEFPD